MLMPLIKHIASGQAFFSGFGLLVLAAILASRSYRRIATLAWALGVMLIAVSATPLHPMYYLIAGLISLGWIVKLRPPKRSVAAESSRSENSEATDVEVPTRRPSNRWTAVFLGVWLIGVGLELPYHIMPTIPPASVARLTIFADSVSAGMGEGEAIIWPALFARAHPVEVVDFARMGATARSATVLAEQNSPEPGIVLLEIGGNDILGSTSRSEFERTLDELLQAVTGGDRQVVMLELPLAPTYNGYGRIQRQLAAKHKLTLIPKRFLMDVLLSKSTTVDSIHLNQQGHQRMSDNVWTLLRKSFDAS